MVACDLLPLDPVPGAVTLPGRDFTAPDTWREIREALGGRKVSCDWRRGGHGTPVLTSDWLQVGLVLSDMAPNLSGNPGHDHEAITQLVYTVLRYTVLYCAVLFCTVHGAQV